MARYNKKGYFDTIVSSDAHSVDVSRRYRSGRSRFGTWFGSYVGKGKKRKPKIFW